MDQLEFYKSFQFMSELLLAEAIFLFSLQRRRFGLLRAVFAVAASFLFAWLIPVLSASPAYLSFMFFTLFIFTVCMTKFIFREKWHCLYHIIYRRVYRIIMCQPDCAVYFLFFS